MGRDAGTQVELRVDIDGQRPMNRVSADYFEVRRDRLVYGGSMIVDAPIVASTAFEVTITGVSRATWQTDATDVRLTIARGRPGMQSPTATLRHRTMDGETRATYECAYTSAAFRTVLLEEDTEQGVQRFESYDTGSLPAPCGKRTLNHLSAFEEAGIEMVPIREPGEIAAVDTSWSDAELHAAMVKHFSQFADVPQWAMWLLHARLHDSDRTPNRGNLLGLMFDRRGSQRQGCAVFYDAMTETGAERRRTELFACVHEVAHGFNLLHSFQKSLAVPPVPSRPESASWMAYPGRFPGGAEAFWSKFDFRFDDEELRHLRHAMRDDVIMGGNPLTAGAAFESEIEPPSATQADPGLRLKLSVPPALLYGVPVTADFAIFGTTREGRLAPGVLGPRAGNVDILVRGPDGTARAFEPLLRHCRTGDGVVVRAGDPPVRDSAFIQYGKDGFTFDRPGRYEITARCDAPHGVTLVSNVARIVVRPPESRADRDVARLVFDDQQGELMSLVGSDAPELRRGNEALQAIIDRHPRHAVASVARVVRATNAAREFKALQLDGSVRTRRSDPRSAASILRGTPILEKLGQAASHTSAEMLPRVILRMLAAVPNGGKTYTAGLQPYVRSRIKEIALAVPYVISVGEPVQRRGPASPMSMRPLTVDRGHITTNTVYVDHSQRERENHA